MTNDLETDRWSQCCMCGTDYGLFQQVPAVDGEGESIGPVVVCQPCRASAKDTARYQEPVGEGWRRCMIYREGGE